MLPKPPITESFNVIGVIGALAVLLSIAMPWWSIVAMVLTVPLAPEAYHFSANLYLWGATTAGEIPAEVKVPPSQGSPAPTRP